jgi:hypothetical protein
MKLAAVSPRPDSVIDNILGKQVRIASVDLPVLLIHTLLRGSGLHSSIQALLLQASLFSFTAHAGADADGK